MTLAWTDIEGEDRGAAIRWRVRHGKLQKPGRGRGSATKIGVPFGQRAYRPRNIHAAFELLRKRRVELRQPQKRLAATLGVDITTLAKWETGAMVPSALKFFDWCDALGIRMALSAKGET